MITTNSIVKRRDDVRWRMMGDEAVVLQQTQAEVLVLNPVGLRVLELIDAERTVQDLLTTLAAEYDVEPDTLRQDVLAYLLELADAAVLEQPADSSGPADQ
jgi:hypothetical protein